MKQAGAHRPILVYGASGHTGRFIVSELIEQGFTPVLSGRDGEKLAALSSAHGGLKVHVATLDNPETLRKALHGVDAVINAAGPFAETASRVVEVTLSAGVPYLDVAAEPDIVTETMAEYGARAQRADLALAPGIGFYGGLGNLLATAAMGNWPQADEITLAYSLSSWKPTLGTRTTIEVAEKRRGGQRLVFRNQQLELRNDAAPITEWNFPAPIGKQTVIAEFTTADAVTMSRHLRAREIAEYMTLAPLRDLSDPDLSHPPAVDARGRSAQTFLVEAVVRRENQSRRAVAQGQDIYAITAPLVVQALLRLLAQTQPWQGIVTAGELGDARSFLEALAPQHLTLYFE